MTSNVAGSRGAPDVPGSVAGSSPGVRSDVQRNREALLEADRELFAARSDVPIYEVARRAGVGQATLYRHFPDRRALVAAVAEETFAAFEHEARTLPTGADGLRAVLFLAAASIARSGAFTEVLMSEEKTRGRPAPGSLLHNLVERLLTIIGGPLEQARSAGAISEDFQQDDVILVLAMVKGALESAGPDPLERSAVAERAVRLALYGLFTRGGTDGKSELT